MYEILNLIESVSEGFYSYFCIDVDNYDDDLRFYVLFIVFLSYQDDT